LRKGDEKRRSVATGNWPEAAAAAEEVGRGDEEDGKRPNTFSFFCVVF
jgi:hypothetical protein